LKKYTGEGPGMRCLKIEEVYWRRAGDEVLKIEDCRLQKY